MSITTYAELKTAISSWLEDESGAHTSSLGDFITLGEALLFRRLRTRAMVATTSGALDAEDPLLALPARFAGVMRLDISYGGGVGTPDEMPADAAIALYGFSGNGLPKAFAIEGDNLRFWPTPDEDYNYSMAYRQKPEALSDLNTSNWLLASAPDAYLYASLVAAGIKIESPKTSTWVTALSEVVDALTQESINDSATAQSAMKYGRGTP